LDGITLKLTNLCVAYFVDSRHLVKDQFGGSVWRIVLESLNQCTDCFSQMSGSGSVWRGSLQMTNQSVACFPRRSGRGSVWRGSFQMTSQIVACFPQRSGVRQYKSGGTRLGIVSTAH